MQSFNFQVMPSFALHTEKKATNYTKLHRPYPLNFLKAFQFMGGILPKFHVVVPFLKLKQKLKV